MKESALIENGLNASGRHGRLLFSEMTAIDISAIKILPLTLSTYSHQHHCQKFMHLFKRPRNPCSGLLLPIYGPDSLRANMLLQLKIYGQG